jgi:C4-dicarboxylate-specific signal transduction histidine kinase
MSFWFVIAAIVFLVTVIVLFVRLSPGERPEARPSVPESFVQENDPRELLEGLPDSVRLPMERMLSAHTQVSQMRKGSPLPAQATDLIAAAAPLALEVARLEEYLSRYDLRQVVLEAQSDVSRRVLLADLERMSTRHTALTEAIALATSELESVQDSGSEAGKLESAVHRLRLL